MLEAVDTRPSRPHLCHHGVWPDSGQRSVHALLEDGPHNIYAFLNSNVHFLYVSFAERLRKQCGM